MLYERGVKGTQKTPLGQTNPKRVGKFKVNKLRIKNDQDKRKT